MTFATTAARTSKMEARTFVTNTPNQPLNYSALEPGRVYSILSELGYSPIMDCGKFYRTRAAYRGGDTLTSLKVWKNSGYCIDYGNDQKFSFYDLLRHHYQDHRKIKELIGGKISVERPKPKPLEMPRTYPPDCLSRLLPNYFFYTRKKISAPTMKKYKAGFATTGPMYNRMVFPIFDEVGDKLNNVSWY
jgi:hypothetical protein